MKKILIALVLCVWTGVSWAGTEGQIVEYDADSIPQSTDTLKDHLDGTADNHVASVIGTSAFIGVLKLSEDSSTIDTVQKALDYIDTRPDIDDADNNFRDGGAFANVVSTSYTSNVIDGGGFGYGGKMGVNIYAAQYSNYSWNYHNQGFDPYYLADGTMWSIETDRIDFMLNKVDSKFAPPIIRASSSLKADDFANIFWSDPAVVLPLTQSNLESLDWSNVDKVIRYAKNTGKKVTFAFPLHLPAGPLNIETLIP